MNLLIILIINNTYFTNLKITNFDLIKNDVSKENIKQY